jgi:hypothetical protein
MNEFSVAEYADIVYLYGYCDGNGLQASREYYRRVFVIRNIFLSF